MKKQFLILSLAGIVTCFVITSCNSGNNDEKATSNEPTATNAETTKQGGQSAINDPVSQKNVVQIAMGSKDHTTLVAAVKAGELVDALSNNGPFTVFAPTNEAFDKLPKGTVEELLKPEKKEALQNILQYHVIVGVFKAESFKDGEDIGMVNGDHVKMAVKDGKVSVNGANIIASIPASNGIIHVLDGVLLPPK
jgi:uncharacterized surface protein with fasciclin (FAS1) repeats